MLGERSAAWLLLLRHTTPSSTEIRFLPPQAPPLACRGSKTAAVWGGGRVRRHRQTDTHSYKECNLDSFSCMRLTALVLHIFTFPTRVYAPCADWCNKYGPFLLSHAQAMISTKESYLSNHTRPHNPPGGRVCSPLNAAHAQCALGAKNRHWYRVVWHGATGIRIEFETCAAVYPISSRSLTSPERDPSSQSRPL
jgi:hypothetical protein